MVVIYWYKEVGTSRGKTQGVLVAQGVLIIQAWLQMLQKTHHRVCKTPVKYWSCYVWHWQADGGDAKPSVCNKNPAAEREKKTITQPFNELGRRCQCFFAEKAFQKSFFRVSFRLLIFIFIPHRASCMYGKHWSSFPDVLKTKDAFGFPTYLQVSYPDGNKAELEAVHKKVNLLYIPVWSFLTWVARTAAPERKTQGTKILLKQVVGRRISSSTLPAIKTAVKGLANT